MDWQIVDLNNLVANVPTNTQTLTVQVVYDLGFTVTNTADGWTNFITSTHYKDYTDN